MNDRLHGFSPRNSEPTGSVAPLVTEHVRAFVKLCERGLSQRDEIAGWHGTSLEAMEVAIRLGGLSPSPIAHAKAQAGHLFFYPPGGADFESSAVRELRSDGRPGAHFYALGNARYHFLMREAGLDFSDPRIRLRVYEAYEKIDEDPRSAAALRVLEKLGIEPGRASGVREELFRRSGFMVALSKSALERFSPSDGDVPGDDLKIFVPGGLPFDLIAGIEPLGDAEFQFFEELQALVERDLGR